jgi:hypothetical protein
MIFSPLLSLLTFERKEEERKKEKRKTENIKNT